MKKADYEAFRNRIKQDYPWMPRALRQHYGRLYGTRIDMIAGGADSLDGLGRHFGGTLYEAEVDYLVQHEWARTAEDILWRRTKHRLHLTEAEQAAFADWFDRAHAQAA
jgi:glycerol-3-phosphate dehydrogenase